MGSDLGRRGSGRIAFSNNVIDMLEVSGELAALCHLGLIVDINSAGRILLGAENRASMVGRHFATHIAGDYAAVVDDMLSLELIELAPVPVRLQRLDGSYLEVALFIHPARELGEGCTVVTARDISHEGRLAKSAQINGMRFRTLVDKSMHLICHCEAGRVVYINAAGLYLLGAEDPAQVCGRPVAEMFHGPYRDIFSDGVTTLMAQEGVIPVRLARFDGGVRDVQIQVTMLAGDGAAEFMIEARDITGHNRAVAALRHMNETLEQQVAERTAELRRLATTDVLTGLSNRRHFMDLAKVEVERARRHGRPLTALMLDIDYFKRVNDTWGHPVGDEVIRAVAQASGNLVRKIDVVGRLGGEEFAVLLPETGLDGAMLVAERLRRDVGALRVLAGADQVVFTVSIGVAQLIPADSAPDMVLSRADAALYKAKTSGRNRVVAAKISPDNEILFSAD
jgi:diguanylate cyclase (GGDEF)-like protein/PAS domain S-box-containing protein